jgi:hypothetical protein
LGATEVLPIVKAFGTFLSGGGGNLNIERCFAIFDAIIDERFFEVCHDGKEFAGTDECE